MSLMRASRRRSMLVAASCVLTGAAVAGCGQQTDERVAEASQVATPESSEAVSASEPSTVPSEASAPAETATATTAFVSDDCATLEQIPVDAPPAGVSSGNVTVSDGPNGAPVVTVSTTPESVTELQVVDIVEGSGSAASSESVITFNYCGVGLGTQAVFDSSWANGSAATFPLAQLIPGWQQGLDGMKAGGSRLLVIPGELAYGPEGAGTILPNESLAFVVELQAVS